jgi:Cu-processing system permease protein
MSGVLTIARLTFHEARRRKLLAVVLVLGGAFLVLFGAGLFFVRRNITANAHAPAMALPFAMSFMVMAGLYAVNFLIVMTSVLVPIETFSGEIASGAIQTLATKPVTRAGLLLGKWLGCAALVALYVALLAGGVLVVARVVGSFTPPGIGVGLPLLFLEAGVILTLSLAIGTRLSGLSNGAAAFGLYGLAFVGGWIEQVGTLVANDSCRYLGIVASLLLPSESLWQLAAFHMQNPVMRDLHLTPFSPASVPSGAMVGWAAGYLLVLLGTAAALFHRRDL